MRFFSLTCKTRVKNQNIFTDSKINLMNVEIYVNYCKMHLTIREYLMILFNLDKNWIFSFKIHGLIGCVIASQNCFKNIIEKNTASQLQSDVYSNTDKYLFFKGILEEIRFNVRVTYKSL